MDSLDSSKFCCLCFHADHQSLHELEPDIQELFFELTQIKIKSLASKDNLICHQCLHDLTHCIKIRRNFIDNQMKFEHEESMKNEYFIEESTDIAEDFVECPDCFNLVESSKITKHMTTHTQLEDENTKTPAKKSDKKRRQCVMCGLLVKNLQEHVKVTHSSIKRFFCDICNYSCYFKTKIARHMQKHIPKSHRELFRCSDCQFECSRKDALKSHILTMHQINREKNFQCLHCHKLFFNKSQLGIHTKSVHEKIRNHTCSICGKSFFNAKDLSLHETRHYEKKEKCSECDALFHCLVDLRRHIKNRHTAASIECKYPQCGKKFHSNSKLKAHIKTRHEHLKEYQCPFCDATFSQYNNLKRHIDSVHKALKIACVIADCNYTVSRKDKYKNHLISQHKYVDEKTRNSILKNVRFE